MLKKVATGGTPTKAEKGRYNHPDIKHALMVETNRKCAYCESKLRHITYGDIEHVVPKASDQSKWFSWPNLTLACDVCNTNKSDAPVEGETFIDPYKVDPEEHFWQIGSAVYSRPGCDAAALTERLLDLNRPDLLERRSERISNLLKMLGGVRTMQGSESEAPSMAGIHLGSAESQRICSSVAHNHCVRSETDECRLSPDSHDGVCDVQLIGR